MKTSESTSKIIPALLAVQRAVDRTIKTKVGKIQTKSGGSYEYHYSDLSSVIDEVKGPLNENGIVFLQSAAADERGVTVTTRLHHESGEWIEEALYMPVGQATPQAYGSVITYCRRYGLQTLTGLKAEDDDGSEASKKKPEDEERKPNTAKQVAVDAFELLPVDVQHRLHNLANSITDLHTNGEPMVTYVERQKLDTEEKLGLWSLLPSNIRSAYKKEQQRMREESQLASQP